MKNTLLQYVFLIFISSVVNAQPLVTGAQQTNAYLPLLLDKKVGMVVNQTSTIEYTHLVDSLQQLGVSIQRIFAPEHGFRGDADAGEHVKNGVDPRTGIPITSLYGSNKKPSQEQLQDIDMVVFDIQDVGVRFYTFISTMHYVMEACAEHGIALLVLDRPNPNGHYVAGPVLDTAFRSFVGMHPIPVVHGLTVGELATMVNDEGWLANGISCDLTVIPCLNYTHSTVYSLPIKPSPNLPNDLAIRLYPSLCFFEPTSVSIGRGTPFPFQVIGHPELSDEFDFHFTPQSIEGMAKYPKHENKTCYGIDYRVLTDTNLLFTLEPLYRFYQLRPKSFFTSKDFFDKLAGTSELREQIENRDTLEAIEERWAVPLQAYKKLRKNYLLYPDFE